MALAMEYERDNVLRMDLQGKLRRVDLDRCQQRLGTETARLGPVRLLIVLDSFAGWDPDAPWNDLSFSVKSGSVIERIAVVGPGRWRRHMLMFAGADLRRAAVEFFLPEAEAEARAWLSS